MIEFILLLIAFILLILAAFRVSGPIDLGWAGTATFILVFLIRAWP